jgi:short-subunit dehydrogenase
MEGMTRTATHRHAAALVTGATSGIGEAFARALPTATGVLLTGRDAAALERSAAELVSPGRRVETVAADLATDAGLDAVAARAEAFGVDLLIANAGVGPFGDFLQASEESLRATVSVNVMAPVVLARRLLPGMLARARAGRRRAGLIVVSSNAAFVPVPRLAAYAASKAFDLSLAEALAAELAAEPIDVLALCPTATRTRFAARSGFGNNLPGAENPADVAAAALRALGQVRTLVRGPVSGLLLSGPAFARAALAQAFARVLPRR